MLRVISALVFALMLSACATAGTKVSADQLAQLHKGTTTIEQTIQILGKPQGQMAFGGKTQLIYNHTSISPDGVTFVPVIGAFAGSTTAASDMVTLTFDGAGVLTEIGTSASATTARGPLASSSR